MLNKFIFSGMVNEVDLNTDTVTFNVLIPDGNSMLMKMTFTKEICTAVSKSLDAGQAVICVEGFVTPDEKGNMNLKTTSVTTTSIPRNMNNKNLN